MTIQQNQVIGVNFQGVCITCVEALSQCGTKALVYLNFGGPGNSNVRIHFHDINKQDFNYALNIWGVLRPC